MAPTLRDRNRVATYRAIRAEAVRLFEELGYDEVSVEMVASKVGVSVSTIFRYFGSKEQLLIGDEFLDQEVLKVMVSAIRERGEDSFDHLIELVTGQGPDPVEFDPMVFAYVRDVPDVRRAYADQLIAISAQAAQLLGGEEPTLGVRMLARSLVFGLSAATEQWYEAQAPLEELATYVRGALETMRPLVRRYHAEFGSG